MEGQNLAGVAGGRVRKHHRKNPFLPKRPKKAKTAYTLFLQEWYTQNAPSPGRGSSMRTVSQMWRNLPEDEKADYAVRAEPHAARYNRQINLWKIMQKALKRPSSAYIIFLQGVWTRERNSGRTVPEMSTYAKGLWASMPDAEKEQYRTQFRDLSRKYTAEIARLNAGGMINPEWRTQPIAAPVAPVPVIEEGEADGGLEDLDLDEAEDIDLEEGEDDLDFGDDEDDLDFEEDEEDEGEELRGVLEE